VQDILQGIDFSQNYVFVPLSSCYQPRSQVHWRHERCGGSCITENLPGLRVIQDEKGKVQKVTLEMTQENFDQEARVHVCAHKVITTRNWLTGTHPAPVGQTTTSPAFLPSLGMEFQLTFSWLLLMSILLDQ